MGLAFNTKLTKLGGQIGPIQKCTMYSRGRSRILDRGPAEFWLRLALSPKCAQNRGLPENSLSDNLATISHATLLAFFVIASQMWISGVRLISRKRCTHITQSEWTICDKSKPPVLQYQIQGRNNETNQQMFPGKNLLCSCESYALWSTSWQPHVYNSPFFKHGPDAFLLLPWQCRSSSYLQKPNAFETLGPITSQKRHKVLLEVQWFHEQWEVWFPPTDDTPHWHATPNWHATPTYWQATRHRCATPHWHVTSPPPHVVHDDGSSEVPSPLGPNL